MCGMVSRHVYKAECLSVEGVWASQRGHMRCRRTRKLNHKHVAGVSWASYSSIFLLWRDLWRYFQGLIFPGVIQIIANDSSGRASLPSFAPV